MANLPVGLARCVWRATESVTQAWILNESPGVRHISFCLRTDVYGIWLSPFSRNGCSMYHVACGVSLSIFEQVCMVHDRIRFAGTDTHCITWRAAYLFLSLNRCVWYTTESVLRERILTVLRGVRRILFYLWTGVYGTRPNPFCRNGYSLYYVACGVSFSIFD